MNLSLHDDGDDLLTIWIYTPNDACVGSYTRVHCVKQCVQHFLEATEASHQPRQIVLLGAGMDTLALQLLLPQQQQQQHRNLVVVEVVNYSLYSYVCAAVCRPCVVCVVFAHI